MEKMREVNRKIVDAAVAYWANFLKNRDQVVHDNGEPTQFAMMNVLSKLAGTVNYPQEAVEDFEVALSNIIEVNLNEFGRLTLGVDYHPDNNLSKALKESLKEYNSMTIFPCKTSMIVNQDVGCIDVSEGYGKSWQRIYPAEINTNMLNHNHKYLIVGNQNKDVQIVIDFKYYRCELDIVALDLNLEADSIHVTSVNGKFFAEKYLTPIGSPVIKKEIVVKEYVGDL